MGAIGYTYLDLAAKSYPDVPYSVHRRPFILYPDLPKNETDEYHGRMPLVWQERLDVYFRESMGPNIRPWMDALAKQAGLSFDFSAVASNTFDSHRLLLWAENHGKGPAVGKVLIRRYFEQGERLASHDVLCAAAAEVGLGLGAARAMLASDEYIADVEHALETSRRAGIHSIPVFFFTLAGREWKLHGASKEADFAAVFAEAQMLLRGAGDL